MTLPDACFLQLFLLFSHYVFPFVCFSVLGYVSFLGYKNTQSHFNKLQSAAENGESRPEITLQNRLQQSYIHTSMLTSERLHVTCKKNTAGTCVDGRSVIFIRTKVGVTFLKNEYVGVDVGRGAFIIH